MTPATTTSMEERLREELLRRTDEVELLRELLSEATGLTLDGVAELMSLHRRARGDLTREGLLSVLGRRFWPTGVVARSMLPNGGRGIAHRERSEHHHRVTVMLKQLAAEGLVESRFVKESNRVEWRRP